MQVTQTAVDGLRHEFKVVLSAQDIEAKITDRLNQLGSQVRVPGFRPGKVPLAILKKRYGDSVLGEVVERAVADSSQQAITSQGLRPALRPKIEITSFEKGSNLEYKLAIEVLPRVEPMDFTTLALERLVAEVSAKEEDEALERLAAQYKRSEPAAPGHISAKGDIAVIDFKGTIAGQDFPGGASEGYYLELGAGQFIPGFEEQLEGLEAGASKTVEVTFPANYASEALRGKAASFAVTLKEIRRPIASKVDEQLAKDLGLESLAALRKNVHERLEREYGEVAKARLKRALLDALAEAHHFAVPEGMLEVEFAQIWQQVEESRKRGELEPDEATKSEDELKADYRAIAERRVRLGLLLSEVGERHNITVAAEELNRAMFEEARRFPGQERQVLEYFKTSPESVAQLRAPLFEGKVVDFILELAKPSERKVTVAELVRDPDEAAPPTPPPAGKPARAGAARKKTAGKDAQEAE
ncbi:MAG TPA: trigger factor [Alphaproteobacteria bacterium]|nr:trigger factor [Alphaproteobacteria bacterium]